MKTCESNKQSFFGGGESSMQSVLVTPTCSWFSWFSYAVSPCESNTQSIFMIQSCSQSLWIQHAVNFHDSVMQSVLVNPTRSWFSWFSHAVSPCESNTQLIFMNQSCSQYLWVHHSWHLWIYHSCSQTSKKKPSRDPIRPLGPFFILKSFPLIFLYNYDTLNFKTSLFSLKSHLVSRPHFFPEIFPFDISV